MPVRLLYSPHHSDLAVMLYALTDLLSGKEDGPAAAKRAWLAERLDCSESGIAKALGQLTHEHKGEGLTPDSPAFMVSTVRGRKLSALRDVVRSIPRVKYAEATLGAEYPIVTPAAFRLFGILLDKRSAVHAGTVKLPRAELAQLARRRPKTITALLRELADAGWLVKRDIAGDRSVIALNVTLDEDGMAAALAALDLVAPEATTSPVENGVEKLLKTRESDVKGGAPSGTSPGASSDTSGGSSAGTSIRVPAYLDPAYIDPSSGAPADPPGRRADGSWCGRCLSPSRRVHVDPDTNRRTPCPTCAPPLRVVA